MILVFGYTTPALLAGAVPTYTGKTKTRREWSEDHAAMVWAANARDGHIDAWNANPRNPTKDPHKVATIRLTAEPVFSNEFPEGDYEAEGFPLLQRLGVKIGMGSRQMAPRDLWRWWQELRPWYYVVSFELVELTPLGYRDLERLGL